ncbi:shikimate dehydrogenase [Ancylomarina sp. 16SWW S1-10-2]|uniref:shikimate dehydrogenase family protein n=1 Tax=Ancylomarina sp. 16SWW S1-10-2 TaxID=2499681 RepID=UPI0012AE19C0|nr:shikimate dehydrogenase [Ancylomarina sp. 16SWW S1-10-2]MRT93551.1 shikimate dehydrogenase [Ancylomarina sp. 16SWW S1-10-2]
MKTYGILGNPLRHSFSKQYFTDMFLNDKIDAQFLNFEIPRIEKIIDVIHDNPTLAGLCVTIPYKQEVMAYLDEIDPLAKRIGAVNSIQFSRQNGKTHLKGYNTDIFGFMESLTPLLNGVKPKALILGTGGVSKAVATGLEELDIPYRFVSRTATEDRLSYEMLSPEIMTDYHLIVNCTPLGTFPKNDTCPNIPYQLLSEDHFLYDVVYNPAETLFMKKGAEQKAKTQNGLPMLHLQAVRNWDIWNK